jgi:hypothetical protein
VACQEELGSKINAIKAGQSEFVETITDMIDKKFKSVIAVIKQHAENL